MASVTTTRFCHHSAKAATDYAVTIGVTVFQKDLFTKKALYQIWPRAVVCQPPTLTWAIENDVHAGKTHLLTKLESEFWRQ